MINNNKEYILCAAIHYLDLPTQRLLPKNISQGIVVCSYRHAHCIALFNELAELRSVKTECGDYIQGFITSTNRFLNRVDAAKLAIECGQIEKLQYSDTELFSEDLY